MYKRPYFYFEGQVDISNLNSDEKKLNLLDYYMKLAQTYCNFLWLLKDNSVSIQQGFIYVKENDGTPYSVSSNMRTPFFFNSKGGISEDNFNQEEIKSLSKFIESVDNSHIEKNVNEISLAVNTEVNRLERFLYFLQAARTQSNLASRIGMYCTLLETLLSTDSSEISHKISERLAKLIGKTYDERVAIFSFIKNAYNVRSSTIHGDKLKKNYRTHEKLVEISTEFDNYLRQLFILILEDQTLNDLYSKDDINELNKYFRELILK